MTAVKWAGVMTLVYDCGGGGIKASVVDETHAIRAEPIWIETPYPLPPNRFAEVLRHIESDLRRAGAPSADRATVGMPGMIRHGTVVATPHYITSKGPRTAIDPDLERAWANLDVRDLLHRALGIPVLVLNDAEVHGAGLVSGIGLELVLTLGTGLGCALFDGGRLAPHIELSHAPMKRLRRATYDTYIGETERKKLGNALWSRRVQRLIVGLRPVFRWDRLYIGGGNSKIIERRVSQLGSDVVIVPNSAGILGGAHAWTLAGHPAPQDIA